MRFSVPIVLCASSLIAGCAAGMFSSTSGNEDIDTAKVSAINRISQKRGVEVHWYSYPQRKALAEATPVPTVTPRTDEPPTVLPTGS